MRLNIRRPFTSETEVRKEVNWPLPSTEWTKIYLDGQSDEAKMSWERPEQYSHVSFKAMGEPVTFFSAPLTKETEITGPLAAKLFVSSSTTDADLFVTFQAFSPDGREVEFQGTVDPHTPLAQGWLRASHRKLDVAKSKPYRPFHTHDEVQPLVPGDRYELDVEIWPTNIVLPAGFRLALQVSGKDFEREAPKDSNEAWVSKGSGPWLHNLAEDRPGDVFGGQTTVYTGGEGGGSYLLLPIVPSR